MTTLCLQLLTLYSRIAAVASLVPSWGSGITLRSLDANMHVLGLSSACPPVKMVCPVSPKPLTLFLKQ